MYNFWSVQKNEIIRLFNEKENGELLRQWDRYRVQTYYIVKEVIKMPTSILVLSQSRGLYVVLFLYSG